VGVVGLIEASIKGIKTRAKGTGVLIFVALLFTGVEIGVLVALMRVVGMMPMAALTALLLVNFVFIYLMRSFTPEGRRLMDEIEGLEQFMTSVDSDRLRREGAPEKTPSLFEKVLPFALALGVEQAWARQFEGVLAQAAMAQAGGGYSPTWYSGNDYSSFNANSFASSVGGDFSSAVSSASSPPSSSSGGGGGGSSGGGGGGGGGGGW
jgi:uncharacterized membrane protein